MNSTENSSTWNIVEWMADGEPTLIFDGKKPRQYVSIRRREHYRQLDIDAAILDAVKAAVTSFERVEQSVTVKEGYPPLQLIADPILGPLGVSYGAQVWIGPTNQPVPPVRAIGAFEWDPATEITYHGRTIETEILGHTEPKEQRVSPEIFRHFEAFPREGELGRFIAEMNANLVEHGAVFDSRLTLKRMDGVVRQAYMTMRAIRKDKGAWMLRGLVHDISDVEKPQLTDTYDRRTARTTAALIAGDDPVGIGHIDFATGIVADWLTPPPAPLDGWLVHNPEFHVDNIAEMNAAQLRLAKAETTKEEYRAWVRFPDTDWIEAKFLLAAATPGVFGHGLIRVEVVAIHEDSHKEDGDNPEQGGPLLW